MQRLISIRAFWSYTARFKGAFWITATAFALSDIVITAVPWLIGRLTASLTAQDGDIVFWTAMLIVASIGHDILWRIGEVLYMKLMLPPAHRINDEIFTAVMRQPYKYFVDKFTGKISSYANTISREYRDMLNNVHFKYINIVVALPIVTAIMFTVNIWTGIIFIISLAMMFASGWGLAAAAAKAQRKLTDKGSSIDGLVVDAIANFVSIKAFGNEKAETGRLKSERNELIGIAQKAELKSIIFWGVMSLFVRWVIWPATFILNVYLYVNGQIGLTEMATFLTAIVLFSNFIWEVIWYVSQINITIANVEEAYRYLFGERNIFKEDSSQNIKQLAADDFKKALELRDISFAYPDQPKVSVLKNISISIRQGQKIGIVGPSGGGKSTLLKLLLGYYPIVKGQLLIDGRAIDNQAITELTAYVPQDTAVFHRPIRENITYGRQDAGEQDVIAAAKHAQAHQFITQLENGYETYVGERGVKLSGGQRQRIAIARAILKDSPLLMLDEATSALDSESEKLIQSALWELMKGRTAIVIAHRLSTIQKMDRIIVLDNGQIAEEGTHKQLLARGGIYARLWQHQSGGFIEE